MSTGVDPAAGAERPSLFVADGDSLVPTDYARGPWSRDHLHGGPVAALLARSAERCAPREAVQVARLTVELTRPVTLAPIVVEARLHRPGRRVQLVEVTARQAGREVALARALRIRTARIDLPPEVQPPEHDIDPPGSSIAMTARDQGRAFHTEGAELRFASGAFGVPGPATVWIRLRTEVVAGEPPSPLERVAAAADFGNGVSSPLNFGSWLFINPDLTIHLTRLPVGEWVCLESHSWTETRGIGLAESRLWDADGVIGRSVQSLLVEPVRPR